MERSNGVQSSLGGKEGQDILSLSDDGLTLAVGTPELDNTEQEENIGQVRVFHLVEDVWTQLGQTLGRFLWAIGFRYCVQ